MLNLVTVENSADNMKKLFNSYNIPRSTLQSNPKREFDPSNPEDIAEYRHFLKKGGWKDVCPFELRWPYTSVPQMIADQIAEYYVFKVSTKTK